MTYQFKNESDLKDGDMVAGVCYAAAAEQIIRRKFGNSFGGNPREDYQPTVIGYLVRAETRFDFEKDDCAALTYIVTELLKGPDAGDE